MSDKPRTGGGEVKRSDSRRLRKEAAQIVKMWRNMPKLYKDCWRIVRKEL